MVPEMDTDLLGLFEADGEGEREAIDGDGAVDKEIVTEPVMVVVILARIVRDPVAAVVWDGLFEPELETDGERDMELELDCDTVPV